MDVLWRYEPSPVVHHVHRSINAPIPRQFGGELRKNLLCTLNSLCGSRA